MINISGQRFGRLLVKEVAFIGKDRKVHWRCICDCGKETTPVYYQLVVNKTQSCGCVAREKTRQRVMKPEGMSSKNTLYKGYRNQAKARELEFSLTFDEFIRITSSKCHYCDKLPSCYEKRKKANGGYRYNGIDRVDNLSGYTNDNSVPCCKPCNYRKKANTKDEFIAHTMRIARHQQRLEMAERMKGMEGRWWGGVEVNEIERCSTVEASFRWTDRVNGIGA